MIAVNLVIAQAAAKQELLFNKPALDSFMSTGACNTRVEPLRMVWRLALPQILD